MQRVAEDIFRCAWKDTEHWERPQCCHSQNLSHWSWPPTHDRTLFEGQRTKGASSSYCSKMSTSSRLSFFLGRLSSTIACCCCSSTRTLLLSCSLHFCPRTHFQHLGPYPWVKQSVQGWPEKLCVLFRFIIILLNRNTSLVFRKKSPTIATHFSFKLFPWKCEKLVFWSSKLKGRGTLKWSLLSLKLRVRKESWRPSKLILWESDTVLPSFFSMEPAWEIYLTTNLLGWAEHIFFF